MSSGDSVSTPTNETTSKKKRFLSSPFDTTERKKYCSNMDPSENPKASAFSSEDLASIGAALKASFHDELTSMIEPIIKNSVSAIVDGILSGLQSKITALETENIRLKHVNDELRSRIVKLESAADDAEQYSRRNCLRITGIVESTGESTDDKILEICQKLKLDIKIQDIDRSHRIGKPVNKKSRPVIVKFVSYRVRKLFYKARTKLKDVGLKGVFVNEDLTQQRNHLMYMARQLAKRARIHSCWSSDGKIFVKDLEENTQIIKYSSDLLSYE